MKMKEKEYIPASTAALIPICTIDKGLFVLKDGTYMDIFEITSKDLISASDDEVEYDMLQWQKFHKMYGDDCKIIGLNFPTDTKEQQLYFQHKISTTTNPLFREILESKFTELEEINLSHTDRQYYLMIFSNNYDKYLDNRNIITVTLRNQRLVSEMELDDKIKVLQKLSNKPTSIYS